MISYLIDGAILLVALGIAVKVHMTTRELRRLRSYHEHYEFLLEETATAVSAVDATVREIQDHGAQILLALGERITDAYKAMGEIDAQMAAAAGYEIDPTASNVLQFAGVAANPPRQAERRAQTREPIEQDDAGYELPQSRRPAARQPRPAEKPVKWPALGDRFNAWRSSEEPSPRQAMAARKLR